MNKVTVVQKANEYTIPAKDLAVGHVGRPDTGPYKGLTLLRTSDGLVVLERPSATWNNSCTLRVVPLGPCIITIEIEK